MHYTKSLRDWCDEHDADKLLRCYEAGGNPLPAGEVGFSSPAVVTFRCPECDYKWTRSLNKATRKGARLGCPACDGRVPWKDNVWTKKYPELLLQWDMQQNTVEPEHCGNINHLYKCNIPLYCIPTF